jgi:hypothetical protein
MATWKELLKGDPLPWMLEPDESQPAVRYLAMRDLLGHDENNGEVRAARDAVMTSGPVVEILAAQDEEGYWVKPGPGYGPKYMGTIWQVVFLGQFAADGDDPRVRKGCKYMLDHNVAAHGGLTINRTPSTFVHCMAGNVEASLIDLGWLGDERLHKALDFQARLATGDGVAPVEDTKAPVRYYKSSTPGPGYLCSANGKLTCAWGVIKALLAFGKLPEEHRTPVIEAAIEVGVDFLMGRDPALADYPAGYAEKPSSSWFRFGYPIGYVTDVLQNLEVLSALGHAQDPRLANALEFVLSKQDSLGRWEMRYFYNGKTWVDIEQMRKPSKWVTLRALRVLKAAYPD